MCQTSTKTDSITFCNFHLICELLVCSVSFRSPAKIFTSKSSSSSTSSNGSPTSTSAAAKPHLRRALSGPREATGGSTTTIIPPEAPSSPTLALKLPPLLDLPSAGLKDPYQVYSNSNQMWQKYLLAALQ